MASTQIRELATGKGRKPILYSLVSVIAVVTGQSVLWTCSGLLGWGPVASNVTSVAIGSIPSYVLNRYWVWGKRGRNHFWKEVAPFWGMAFLGLLLSTLTVSLATEWWEDETWIVSLANLSAFGVIWVGKFFVLHNVLFKDHGASEDDIVIPA